MKIITLITATVLCTPALAMAGIETDRTVGHCAGLLTALQKPDRAAEALGYADNQHRAIQMAGAWMNKIKTSASDQTMIENMIYSATRACREIGIRASR